MCRGHADGRCGTGAGSRSNPGESRLTVSVSLLVPGLAADFGGYANDTFKPAPALSVWVSRARVIEYAATLTEKAIVDLLGIAAGPVAPVASLSYLQDFGEPPSAPCLRADPVHLRADTNGLVLFDAASFELDENDSRALVETLAGYLAADGWDLLQGHPHRWYLSGKQEPDLITIPLPQRRGSPVSAAPFAGKDAAQWMIRLNEMQMLMHNHPVNRVRASRGQVAVNSVWLWGGGGLQTQEELLYTRLTADNVCAQGAARWCDMPASDLTQNADQLLSSLQPDEHVLSVLEACRVAAAYEDFGAWQAAVEDLERDWFAPLVQALRAGRIDRLELLPLNGKRYRLERRHLKFFWKKVEHYGSVYGFRRADATRV